MRNSEIKQGDSLDLEFAHPDGKDLTGWACRVMVKSAISDVTPLVSFNITSLSTDSKSFVGLLNSSTTETLPVGDLHLLAELEDSGAGRKKELHYDLRVLEQGVF